MPSWWTCVSSALKSWKFNGCTFVALNLVSIVAVQSLFNMLEASHNLAGHPFKPSCLSQSYALGLWSFLHLPCWPGFVSSYKAGRLLWDAGTNSDILFQTWRGWWICFEVRDLGLHLFFFFNQHFDFSQGDSAVWVQRIEREDQLVLKPKENIQKSLVPLTSLCSFSMIVLSNFHRSPTCFW